MTVISTNVAIFNIFDSALPTPPCLTLSFKTALVSPFGFVVYFTLPSDGSNQRQEKMFGKYIVHREREESMILLKSILKEKGSMLANGTMLWYNFH